MRLLVLPSGAILEHGAIREPASAVVEEVSMEMVEANMELRWCPREAQGTLRGGNPSGRTASLGPSSANSSSGTWAVSRQANEQAGTWVYKNYLTLSYLILSYLSARFDARATTRRPPLAAPHPEDVAGIPRHGRAHLLRRERKLRASIGAFFLSCSSCDCREGGCVELWMEACHGIHPSTDRTRTPRRRGAMNRNRLTFSPHGHSPR